MYNEGNYKQGEKTPSEWEKIIANEATNKQLISKIYKQLLQVKLKDTQANKDRKLMWQHHCQIMSKERSITSNKKRTSHTDTSSV